MNGKVHHRKSVRIVETALVVAFLLATAVLVIVNPSEGVRRLAMHPSSAVIQAYAYAMPAQGWSPLTVCFSAFGSQSTAGNIVKYEWDLDGNGRCDIDATAGGGYVSHVYEKPGDYVVTLQVTDGQGNVATSAVTVRVRDPRSSSVDYWKVFDDSQIRRVDIALNTDDWNTLWRDPEAKTTVPADATVFGERWENVGFRLRGQFSLRMSGDKKPWKIDTDYFVDGQEFHHLKQLTFLNHIGDPSMLQEKLAYEAMHFAGVPSSHVCFVELWIDLKDDDQPPAFWGIYTLVERVDKKFLANRFGPANDGGNLYRASHAQRGPMNLVYHGPDITDYPTQGGSSAYRHADSDEQADFSDIIHLMYVIDGVTYPTPEEFATAVEQVLNVDTFLRYLAVVNLLANWDSYAYTGNNFQLFHNAETGKFEWIPWDLTWGNDVRHLLFQRRNSEMVGSAPLFDRVFEVKHYRLRYAAYLDLLIRNWLSEANISALAQRYHDQMLPLVRQGEGDKMYFGETAMFPFEAFGTSWRRFGNFARRRREYVLALLANGSWKSPDFDEVQFALSYRGE